MENAIFEYLDYSSEEKRNLWLDADFIFDTNVLLNLYRYSDETRKALFAALDALKPRVWMPYHVAYEFMKNRNTVIQAKIIDYEEKEKEFDQLCEKVKQKFHVSTKKIDTLKKAISSWLDAYKKSDLLVQRSDTNSDNILKQILEIFAGRTGEKYNNEKLETLRAEGKKRFEQMIPPGNRDIDKTNSKNQPCSNMTNEYGDFFIWKEILDYSKINSKNIVLVTNDQKDDWWEICKGKTIGPRTELRREFAEVTDNKKFHMYTMDHFINEYEKYTKHKVSESVVAEVQRIEKTPTSYDFRDMQTTYKNAIENLNKIWEKYKITQNQEKELKDYLNTIKSIYNFQNLYSENLKTIYFNKIEEIKNDNNQDSKDSSE